jgi:ribosome biogenesis protein BMS1
VQAFTSQSGAKAARNARRKADKDQAKLHVPAIDRTFGGYAQGTAAQSSMLGAAASDEGPPPVIVAIIGPPGVGKTTLIRSMVRRYTKSTMTDIKGPVTIVSGGSFASHLRWRLIWRAQANFED